MAITSPTPEQVRAINGSTLDDTAIQPFITAAVCVLEQVEACMFGKGISDECQTQAAAWLAAHLIGVSGIGSSTIAKKSETFENYSVSWATSTITGNGTMSTPYGQAANSMSGGCLQEVDKRTFDITFGGGA